MSDLTTAYFEITKADKNADGTLMVYGKATDDSLDIDQQICDPVWLDTAMPDWFKTGGNIREQHSNIAAGVAKEYEKKADGHYIHALVVDPISVKKVDSGVLKGFSIGIKSPRVVRDTKAANGRIIDGQIVEISLVDRPANPNCQLVLAKSVNGESGVWKVEELIEKSDEVTPEATEVVEEVITEEVVAEQAAAEVTEDVAATQDLPTEEVLEKSAQAKAILASLIKFDKTQYEAARDALANLISVEAGEMKDGHNELNSISHLLQAVAHLYSWYEGEETEGEVMDENIELAAHKDKMVPQEDETKGDFMSRCKEAGMEDDEAKACWDKYTMSKSHHDKKDTDKTHHNKKDMEKSAEDEETTEEVVEEKDSEAAIAESDVEAIVEKAVKSATESIRSEVASLVSAKEAALEKAATLESELATAKSLAIGGGPSRTAKPVDSTTNDLLTKALVYKAKMNAATDPTLVKGYRALHDEFMQKFEAQTK
jgi:hypothetical protein